jgi:hypothetical protein
MVGELAFVAGKVGSLPPCGGELERGISPGLGARGLPLSLTLPHKGGGNARLLAAIRLRLPRYLTSP